MNTIRMMLAAVLLAFAVPALAQPYVWGSIGSFTLDANTVPDVSGRDTSASHLGVGWRFNRYLAVEASYLDLSSLPSHDASTSVTGFWRADGYTLSAVGMLPLSESWSLVGKVGVWNAESEFTTVTMPAGAETTTKQDLGSRPLIGAGVEFALNELLRLRVLYEQIDGKDGLELDKARMVSIGIAVQF